jgi:hypothetical protein
MALASKDIALLAALRARDVRFTTTLMIGRQHLVADEAAVAGGFAEGGFSITPADAARVVTAGGGYAEALFSQLGAERAEAIDASSYQQSTYTHDMNEPLPERLRGRYSFVFDGGTLEHVFNIVQALENCMNAVQVGGHFLTATTCNNYVGHGFYQFSPEFFFRALSPENGFQVRLMLVRAQHRWARWLHVRDPAEVGRRVEMTSSRPVLIYALARRISAVAPFSAWPQQSDYVTAWGAGDGVSLRRRAGALPPPARQAARGAVAVVDAARRRSHFRRVALTDVELRAAAA